MPGEGISPPDSNHAIATSAQLAPGDTASILGMMQQTMSEIDGALGELTRRDTTLPSANPAFPRHLTLWLYKGSPRKLLITEPNETGEMTEESSFWFVDDELRAAVRPFDGYFLEGDRILLWTNGTLEPQRDITDDARMERETAVVAEVKEWLAVFGVTLP